MQNQSRRQMIRTLSASGAALLLSPALQACATPQQKKHGLGIALVGLGYYSADLLAPALQQTKWCHLAAIVTGSPDKAARWQKQYNIPDKNVYDYKNFDSIASNPDVDVVYVVLPTSMHKEFVVRAAAAGKHVWCEKPMAISERECREMIDACAKAKKTLAIGYRLQHEPTTQAWRAIVQNKSLGAVQTADCGAGYFDSRTNHWKQQKAMGGGALYDMGVYAIQGARLGTGMEPIAVRNAKTSTTRPQIYTEVDETTEAELEFPNAVTARIKTSFGESMNYLKVQFQKGLLQVDPYQAYNGLRAQSPLGKIEHNYSVPWQQAKQMDDDAQAIMNNKPLLVPGEEGLRDIRIVEAIYQSARSSVRVNL